MKTEDLIKREVQDSEEDMHLGDADISATDVPPVRGFQRLIHPLSLSQFKRSFPYELLHLSGDIERYSPLLELLNLETVESILRDDNARARAIFRQGAITTLSAEQQDSPAFQNNFKANLFVGTLSQKIPQLRLWEETIQNELELPPSGCQFKLSYSKEGGGFPPHFDRYEAIVLQLEGSKRWHVAPNRSVEFPPENYTAGQRIRGPLAEAVTGKLTTMHLPEDAEVKDLKPGDLLFLPRGYWHQTEAITPVSLSLTINIYPPMRMELLPPDSRDQAFLKDRRWRQPVTGAWGTATRGIEELKSLFSLIEEHRLPISLAGCARLIEEFTFERYMFWRNQSRVRELHCV